MKGGGYRENGIRKVKTGGYFQLYLWMYIILGQILVYKEKRININRVNGEETIPLQYSLWRVGVGWGWVQL